MPTLDYMAQPVCVSIPAFEIIEGASAILIPFKFTVRGGQQVLSHTLRIYANDGSTTPLYTNTITSYIYEQKISTQALYTNGLRNNGEYLFTFQTHGRGIIGYDGNTPIYGDIDSVESLPSLFKTYVTPTLQFTNMPPITNGKAIIQMANYTFDCQYTQSEGELLSSLYFYMYDYNHTLINTSKLYTSKDAINPNPNPQTGMVFEYTYAGFIDDTDYYIKAVATTINNTIIDTEVHLHIDYAYDNGYFVIKATNYANGGYVEVVNNVSEIDGKLIDIQGNTIDPTFIGDNYIDLENGDMLYFNDGYQIVSNAFAKQKWWFPVMLGKTTEFSDDDGNSFTVEYKRCAVEDEPSVYNAYDYIEVTQKGKDVYGNEVVNKKISNRIPSVNQTMQLTSYICIDGNDITVSLAKANIISEAYWNGDSSIILDGIVTNLVWEDESSSTTEADSVIDIDTGYSNVEWGRITNMFWAHEDKAPVLPDQSANIIQPVVSTVYTNTLLQNAVINEFYVTRNLIQGQLSVLPEWDNATIMLANFNGDIIAGNVTWLMGSIDKIKLKRKLVSDTSNNWVTLWEKDINDPNDLGFTYRDYYVPSNSQYMYAMIPCAGGDEQNMFTTVIPTSFNGLYISDNNQTMKLYSNYGITQAQDNILIGEIQPYKSQYPIINKNPYVKYRTASFEGDVLGFNYNADEDNCIQTNFELTEETRHAIVNEVDAWTNFLCNGKTKIIRDWNGNIMLAQVTTPPSRAYDKNSGNSKPTMSFSVIEVGDATKQSDLYKHGLVDVEV